MIYVVLSTYNGEKYLTQQLDSLLAQDCGDFTVWIRDDGSTDNTVTILETYSKRYPHIHLMYGNNIGIIASFFELIKAVPAEANYVAFCDQDDIWESPKLSRAIAMLQLLPNDQPNLYASNLKLINAEARYFRTLKRSVRGLSLNYALVGNVVTGCSTVINHSLLTLLKQQLPAPQKIIMHDWWMYLIASRFGHVFYDKESYIFYRQHGNNAVGETTLRKRMQYFFNRKNKHTLSRQASEFSRLYDNNKLAREFAEKSTAKNFGVRFRYALKCSLRRQTWIDNILLRLLILFRQA